ncbi:MAG: RNA-binding protein hfq [Cyanophyceae cyanobacterium]
MSELNTGLPSTREIQNLIRNEQSVELKLVTDERLVGKIAWQDPTCLCLIERNEQSTLVWRQALVYLKPT